jgi:hypothetical protein
MVRLVLRCIQQKQIRVVLEAGCWVGTKVKVVVMALEPCPKAMRLIMSSLCVRVCSLVWREAGLRGWSKGSTNTSREECVISHMRLVREVWG